MILENTKKLIWNILRSFGIDPDAFEIVYVTDNGSNLISALNGEAHMRCICHCINLVVKQSLEECPLIDSLISECRGLVSHFKRCELQHELTSTLKQDICTRWNSTYDTLWSIWLNFKDVEQMLENRNEGTYRDNIDRQVVKDITDLLSIFKIGSEKLSADDVPTLHAVLPKLNDKIWITDIHYITTFLHPETKSLLTLPQVERNAVVQSVRKMMKTVGIVEDSPDLILNTNNDGRKNKRNKRAKRDISVDDVLKKFASNSTDDDEVYDEITEYMKMKINYQTGENVLSWWKKQSTIFSQLSRLALSLLSIPASSTTSERVFSETGRVLEARRQQLNPDSLRSLVFLRNFR